MKKLTTLTLAVLLAGSSIAYAGSDHDHSANKSSDMSMAGMSGDMQGKMKAMKADMMAIQKESNPEKRKALMKDHMKNMSAMMGTMKGERASMDHMNQMKQFDTRLKMMEAMMEQVVVNQAVLTNPDSVFIWDENADEYQLQ